MSSSGRPRFFFIGFVIVYGLFCQNWFGRINVSVLFLCLLCTNSIRAVLMSDRDSSKSVNQKVTVAHLIANVVVSMCICDLFIFVFIFVHLLIKKY